jgi:hypothetical protein
MAVSLDAESVVKHFAYKNYGQVVQVDRPIYNKDKNIYVSNVRANYPLYIFDDRTPDDYDVRVLKIEHLGQVMLNDKLQIVSTSTTYGDQCKENLHLVLEGWKRQAENIVVSTSSNQLIEIEAFRNYFNQIELILEYLMEYNKIHRTELTRYLYSDNKNKILRYMNLLCSLQITRYEEPYYEMGNTYISIEQETSNEEELLKTILAYLLKYRYPTLRDEFKLRMLEKTAGIDNVIYLPEMETENPIYRTPKSISNSYKKYYDRYINPLKLNQILRRLEKVGAIRNKNNKYFGDDELREEMIIKKKKLEPLSISPHIPNIIYY